MHAPPHRFLASSRTLSASRLNQSVQRNQVHLTPITQHVAEERAMKVMKSPLGTWADSAADGFVREDQSVAVAQQRHVSGGCVCVYTFVDVLVVA